MKNIICAVLLSFSFLSYSIAQKDESAPEIIQCPIIGVSFGYVIPGGDLGDMFKPHFQVGGNFIFKTKTNWLFGVEGDFNFGDNNLKGGVRDRILSDLYNSAGVIIGTENIQQGEAFPEDVDAGLIAYNRGFNVLLKGGKIFPLNKKNPNSGIFFVGGVGMTQNQIIYETVLSGATQIQGDYAKGYDRKTRGFLMTEFIGYWFMSNSSRYMNFYAGVEFGQNWSKSAREYQFDLKGKDTKKYFDQTYTIKLGWMIPLGSRKANEFYFN